METLEGLNDLIYKRLIEKNGNVKITENVDLILYAKSISISENQLVFKILEIEETIDWAAVEKKKQQAEAIEAERLMRLRSRDDQLTNHSARVSKLLYDTNTGAGTKTLEYNRK